jgi:hypothetical protein
MWGNSDVSSASGALRGIFNSFEPVTQTYGNLLKYANKDGRRTGHNFALGSKPATSTINVRQSSLFSSMLSINKFATEKWEEETNFNHQEEVTIRTLDDFIVSHPITAEKRNLFEARYARI